MENGEKQKNNLLKEEIEDLQKKEVDIMAMAQLQRSTAITIDKDKTCDFFKTMSDNRPTEEFWENCKKNGESITKGNIKAMNDLIKKRLDYEKKIDYVELNTRYTPNKIIQQFDCGNDDISDYLHNIALEDNKTGNGVSYILVNNSSYAEGKIDYIYAFATIRATSLNFYESGERFHTKKVDKNGNVLSGISSVEIKMFAIDKAFRGQTMIGNNNSELYSTLFFKIFLEKLYLMSMCVIGFKMIYLRSNTEGEKLYRRMHFNNCINFIETYDEYAEECLPMVLSFEDLDSIAYS